MESNNMFAIENGIVVQYFGTGEEISIPDGVTAIGASAFSNNKSLKSVTLSETVTEIGENAFRGCSSLNAVSLNKGLRIINRRAFFACSIGTITIPESVTYIGEGAFTSPPRGDLIIICAKNSKGEKFAREYGFNFIPRSISLVGDEHSNVKRLIHAYQASISCDDKIACIPDGIEVISCCFAHDLKIEKPLFFDSKSVLYAYLGSLFSYSKQRTNI